MHLPLQLVHDVFVLLQKMLKCVRVRVRHARSCLSVQVVLKYADMGQLAVAEVCACH